MAQPVPRDQDVGHGAQDGAGFIQHQLHQPRVLARDISQPPRLFPRLHISQRHETPLGLGHDLLRHNQKVAGAEFNAAPIKRHMQNVRQIIARSDLPNSGQRYDFDHRLHLKPRAGSNLL